MPQHYLGIDVGTTAVKALVVDESGAVVGEAESPLEVSVPKPGWAEQDPADWWQATVEAVRAACAAAASDVSRPLACQARCTAPCCSTARTAC